jgi:ribosomal protein S7
MSNKSLIINKTLYKNFLGVLLKKGGLLEAKVILDKVLERISEKICNFREITLLKLFISLNSFVEVKKVRIRRKSFLVPFSIDVKRRCYLMCRWLMQAVKEDVNKDSLPNKLSNEILNVIRSAPTRSKKLKKLNISQAISNRSNIHYRW